MFSGGDLFLYYFGTDDNYWSNITISTLHVLNIWDPHPDRHPLCLNSITLRK